MKILVTGAAGQLGREMRDLLEERMPGVTTYADIDRIDLTDGNAVDGFLEAEKFTHIINCAAYTAVDRAEEEQRQCAMANIDIVRNLARKADERGTRILHISTDYVFDGTAHRPYRESDKVNPTSQYGSTKRKGETALLGLAPDSIVIRTGWLYSPYGRNFVKTMLRYGRERTSVNVVFDQIGTPTYAKDLAETIFTIITSPQWVAGIFNYSDEGACSWYDFTKSIYRLAGITDCNVEPVLSEDYPSVTKRPYYSVLDKTLIKATYGIKIPHWEESLAMCMERIKNIEE